MEFLEELIDKSGFEMLIDNKGKVLKKYPDLTVSDITIDEILLFYIKGEQCI